MTHLMSAASFNFINLLSRSLLLLMPNETINCTKCWNKKHALICHCCCQWRTKEVKNFSLLSSLSWNNWNSSISAVKEKKRIWLISCWRNEEIFLLIHFNHLADVQYFWLKKLSFLKNLFKKVKGNIFLLPSA